MNCRFFFRYFFLATVLVSAQFCRQEEAGYAQIFHVESPLPASLLEEHARLLAWADSVVPDDSAGRELQKVLRHHFDEEEKLIFPLLGTLPSLADGSVPEDPQKLLVIAERLRTELGHMSAEHQLIRELFRKMEVAAPEGFGELERSLQRHAKLEEEVLFPAALLVSGHVHYSNGYSE